MDFKKFVNNIIEKVKVLYKDIVVKHYRYFLAGLLGIIFIVVLAVYAGGSKKVANGTEGGQVSGFEFDKKFEHNKKKELTELFEAYYEAYGAGDLSALEKVAYPMSDNEKSYVGVFSQYIEDYQNIEYYSKSGLSKDEYFVSVYYEVKFYGVETYAPGMEFFYVQKDVDGNYYINNLYCSFNFARVEQEMDPEIYAAVVRYEQQEDVIELLQETQDKFDEAVEKDEALSTMITETIPNAMKQWLQTVVSLPQDDVNETETQETEIPATEVTEETEPEEPETEEPETEEPDADDESEDEDTNTSGSGKVRVLDNVKIRESASADSAQVGSAIAGGEFTKLGVEGDWTKIEFSTGTGYIKSEFLEDVE